MVVAGGCLAVTAGVSPEEALLLVNADSWLSRSVANTYVELRGFPDLNVVFLGGIPSHEGISVDQFRELILKPVLAAADRRAMGGRLSCVIYSADFPTWVDIGGDFGGRSMPPMVGNRASLTGLTYLYQGVMARHLDYLDPHTNWYARRPRGGDVTTASWTDEERAAYREAEAFFGNLSQRRKTAAEKPEEFAVWAKEGWERIEPILRTLAEAHPNHASVVYNLACAQAQLGKPDEALLSLNRAVDAGFHDARHMREDGDLASLRNRAEFTALLARLAEWRPDMMPPMPFAGSVGWTPHGQPVPPFKGARYLLSTMLGVGSGRGNSFDEITACLRTAAAADGTRPPGTVYLMRNSDPRSTCREWALQGAADLVRANGVDANIADGVLPPAGSQVAGLLAGTASFDWSAAPRRIVPGAICEHLTSFGGMLDEGAGQTPLTELIRHGAAAASGTVCEPFALQFKFPTAFIHGYYTAGYTLAEAFYLSLGNPYQLLVVGDALCVPWTRAPRLTIEGAGDGAPAKGTTEVRLVAAADEGATPIGEVWWFVDGMHLGSTPIAKPLRIDADRLPLGLHDLTAVAVGAVPHRPCFRAATSLRVGLDAKGCDLVRTDAREVFWGEPIRIERQADATGPLTLVWLGRDVMQLEDGIVLGEVPSENLAIGTVQLRPVLGGAGGTRPVIGAPLAVTIKPPRALELLPSGLVPLMAEGLHVTVADKAVVVAERAEGDWLVRAGLGQGDALQIEAWFDVTEAGLAQFQFRGNLPLRRAVSIDGVEHVVPDGPGWRSIPVVLGVGTHRLTVQTVGRDQPRLDMRYGLRGTRTIGGKEFRRR